MATKMTMARGNGIVNRVVGSKFDELLKKNKDRWNVLIGKVIDRLIGDDLALFKSLPEKWFPEAEHINVSFAGLRDSFSSPQRVPTFVLDEVHVFDADDTLTLEARSIYAEQEDLIKQRREMHEKIKAVVFNFTTIEALVQAWPEVEPYIEKPISLPKSSVPMIPIEILNEELGLPKDSNNG